MTKAQLAKLQKHLNRCTDEMGLYRVKVSRKSAHDAVEKRTLAAVAEGSRAEDVTFYASKLFFALPPAEIDETIAHELLHVQELQKTRLVSGWHNQGLISDLQFKRYEYREERQVLRLQKIITKLLPKWED